MANAGDVLQLLRHILAEPLETAAAARAAFARREMRLPARQVIRQRAAPGLVLRGGQRLGKHFRRPRDLLVLHQLELELVEGLRGSAEALPAQTRRLVPELLDQQIAVAQLGGPRGQHHRLQRGDVVGQGPHPTRKGRQRKARTTVNTLLIKAESPRSQRPPSAHRRPPVDPLKQHRQPRRRHRDLPVGC